MAALSLHEPLTIRFVAGLKGFLDVLLLKEDPQVDLDLSAVDAMDGLGYQCLLAFSARAQSMGKHVRLVQVPPRLAKRLELARTRLTYLPQESTTAN